MLKSHTHVGCTVSEIQNQKDEHQSFQDTAKVSNSHAVNNMTFKIKLMQCDLPLTFRAHSITEFSC